MRVGDANIEEDEDRGVDGCHHGIPFDEECELCALEDAEQDLGEAMSCDGCGCSVLNPCPGGCVWASENLCSRCV